MLLTILLVVFTLVWSILSAPLGGLISALPVWLNLGTAIPPLFSVMWIMNHFVDVATMFLLVSLVISFEYVMLTYRGVKWFLQLIRVIPAYM